MALIYLRIACKMPAIPMGETGIGKTALIELLSNIMSYHYLKLGEYYFFLQKINYLIIFV